MADSGRQVEALEWVLGKLAAKNAGSLKPPALRIPKIEVPKPPAVKPVESQAERQARLSKTRKNEVELWHSWVQNDKHPDHFTPLWKSHQSLLNKEVNKWRGVEVNRDAIFGEATKLYYDALESWNPSMKGGANLTTHIVNHLRGLGRFVRKYQNTAKISDEVADNITPFRTAQEELTAKLGYQPSLNQIVEHTHSKDWTGKRLSENDALMVHRQVRRGLDIDAGGEVLEGATSTALNQELMAARLIYHGLKPDEKKVHELVYPRDGGKPALSTGVLAKRLGWHVTKVSKIRKVLRTKMKKWMD